MVLIVVFRWSAKQLRMSAIFAHRFLSTIDGPWHVMRSSTTTTIETGTYTTVHVVQATKAGW